MNRYDVRRQTKDRKRLWLSAAGNGAHAHPLADEALSAALRLRTAEIETAFAAIEPALRAVGPMQYEDGFMQRAHDYLSSALGIDLPPSDFHATWSTPLDVRSLYGHSVLAVFCRLVERAFDRTLARTSDGEDAEALIRRWGFHAVDITPCADGRLSGVVDYILRIPPSVVTARKSYAGAMFDVEEAMRRWESVELGRFREGKPNAATAPTRYLKIGVYHFSSAAPATEGCAAHGHDQRRAAADVLERLEQFEAAVKNVHGCDACTATLLVGVDTDTDAIRVHVPDAQGRTSVDRAVDAAAIYDSVRGLTRAAAKDYIRDEVAACAGVAADDEATEGMRWFCGYLLKNNVGQVDAVRAWHGGPYADRGHTERLIVIGDPLDDVQLRNLVFQAQMDSVEEGAETLDIGVRILRGLHEPECLPVPILAHVRYDDRIPGARERAERRALRLRDAVLERYHHLAAAGMLHVHAVVRGGDGAAIAVVGTQPAAAAEAVA